MVQQRNIGLCLILCLVTCGLFTIYWLVVLTDDIKAVSGGDGPSGAMTVVFNLCTCGLYGFFWAYKAGDQLDTARVTNGMPPANYALVFLVLMFFGLGIVNFCIAQNEVNKYVPA